MIDCFEVTRLSITAPSHYPFKMINCGPSHCRLYLQYVAVAERDMKLFLTLVLLTGTAGQQIIPSQLFVKNLMR